MKRIINKITLMAVLVAAIGCSKVSEDTTRYIDPAFVGEWHLIEASSEGIEIEDGTGISLSDAFDVYIILEDDGTFEIYQMNKAEQRRYDLFTGTYYCQGGLLIGKYSNGKSWGAEYIPSVSDGKLILKSKDYMETQTYEKGQLDQEKKDDAYIVSVKSAAHTFPPVL